MPLFSAIPQGLRVPWATMRQLVRGSFILLAAMVVVATSASGARNVSTINTASGPIETGVGFIGVPAAADNATQFKRIRATGARYVELHIYWASIAPSGPTQPVGFQPTDPADPNYKWTSFDTQVRGAVAAGLKPIATIYY